MRAVSRLVQVLPLLAVGVLVVWGACKAAVLNAPPTATITLSATPTTIDENSGSSLIRAVIRLPTGDLVPDGILVNFFTTLGRIDAEAKTIGGTATATLSATGTAGTASVTAVSGGAKPGTVDVALGEKLEAIDIVFAPASLPLGGGSVSVTARLRNASGQGLPGRGVTLSVASPGVLGQGSGKTHVTDAQGTVRDTLSTTASVVLTAQAVGSSLKASATLSVGQTLAAAMVLSSNPVSLPDGGGQSTITAYVTDAQGGPAPGVQVEFSASRGTMSPAAATTGSDGRASSVLSTGETADVTAKAEAITQTLRVLVGGAGSQPFHITLAAARVSITVPALSGTAACDLAAGNPQLPVEVVATVQDDGGSPVSGLDVTLSIDDDPADDYDNRGGFCASTGAPSTPTEECCSAAAACAPCSPVPGCPTPWPTPPPATPTPVPTPTPTPPCCNAGALASAKSVTLRTDQNGRVTAWFAFEDTDLCHCVFGNRNCTARILASAASAGANNSITIGFAP